MTSLLDTFSSQNFPGNPTVPPGPPPGYTAPSSVANPASKSAPLAVSQVSAAQSALQETNLQNVVQAVTGAFVPGNSSFDQLEVWAQSLDNGAQNIENLVSSLLGLPASAWDGVNEMLAQVEDWAKQLDGGIQQLLTWWNSLLNGLLGGSGTSTVFDLTSWLQNAEANASAAWSELQDFFATGNWSDLSAAWTDLLAAFFGSSNAWGVTSHLAAPAVANTSHQPQPVPNFPNASSIQAGGGWSWDGATMFGSSGGSVMATASGNGLGLRGVVVPVQPDQTVVLAAQVQWSGLTYSGSNPIQVCIIPWNGNSPGASQLVASVASPGASASWTAVSGTYTVPASGVTGVQMYLVIPATVSAGNVWWTNCTTTISGGFLPTLQAGFEQLQADAQASNAATQTFLQAVLTATTNDAGNIPQWWTDVSSAYQTWAATESGLLSDEFATLEQMVEAMFGFSPSTGLFPQSQIANLEADGENWTAAYDNLQNFLTTWSWTDLTAAWTDLNNALWGGSTGAVGSNIQHGALPSTYSNINQDLLNLFNDVIFADGRSWSNIGADLNTLIGDLVGSTVSNTITPGQIPVAHIGSTGASANLGVDVTAAQAAATTAGTNASIAISSAGAANTLAQGTVDGLYQAFNGGTSTGNPVTTVKTGATASPASNVVGNTGATVTFGAVGSGNSNTTTVSGTGETLSETHSILSTDLGVLCFVSYYAASISGITWSTAVTYGGVAMTQVGAPVISSPSAGGGSAFLEVWWLKSPPTGSKTVSATVTHSGGPSGNILGLRIQTTSYLASKIASINAFNGGATASLSMTDSSSANNMVVGAFSAQGTSLTQSAFNKTSRWVSTDTSFGWGTTIGDTVGASSVTFSETIGSSNISTTSWVGYLVELSN